MFNVCSTLYFRGLIGLCALAMAPMVLAHDFWIEPSTFLPAPGQLVAARLRVGVKLVGLPVPRPGAGFKLFSTMDGAEHKPLVGREGADPAGLFRVVAPGLQVIGYEGRSSTLELPAQKFTDYLLEEGLQSIIALRSQRQQTLAPGRELYARCAKSLVLAGPVDAAQGDRLLGFTLELMAERNPYALAAGQALPLRLVYGKQPLAGALVVALNPGHLDGKISARTDQEGRVSLVLPAGGMWLIKAVHMVPAAPASGADWQSYWASLTFEMPAGPSVVARQ